jgi:diguanylate cyclase (GGDEF)-like protein
VNTHRVLIVDDNPDIHADFAKILRSGAAAETSAGSKAADLARLRSALFGAKPTAPIALPSEPVVLDSTCQGEEAVAMVKAARDEGRPYALAFVDLRMPPGWDGLKTIQELWKIDPLVEVVVCTAFSDHPWSDIEALAQGGDRLLILKKPFDAIEVKRLTATLCAKWRLNRQSLSKMDELERIVAARTAELEAARALDKTRLDQLEAEVLRRTEELRRAATHDELTGLPNRALLHDRLVQALELSHRHPELQVALLFVDLDRFKAVNDTLGHAAGDKLLQTIAARLARVLRNTDTVSLSGPCASTAARLGGDEFCILLTGLHSPQEAAAVAQRILSALGDPYDLDGRTVQTSASIGIACSATGYTRAADMVRDADNAMYTAKAAGAGRCVLFDRTMHEEAMERLTTEADLRASIELQQLRSFYQPIVSLVTGDIIGLEALVRWNHPTRGLIAPRDFLRIAEENGFINPLGLWVLEESCRQLARWRQLRHGEHLTISVNISPRQLADPQFPLQVENALAAAGLPPDALILELTEAAVVGGVAAISPLLERFRALGVRIHLDDFGTGHSSLSLLHSLPLDGLKIDRSFVVHATGGRRYAAILHAIMQLVNNLDLQAVGEGVESMEQVALLQSLGCTTAQGYLFSPPQPTEAIAELLSARKRDWAFTAEFAA